MLTHRQSDHSSSSANTTLQLRCWLVKGCPITVRVVSPLAGSCRQQQLLLHWALLSESGSVQQDNP